MKTPFAICALGSSAVVGAAPLALFGSIVMAAPDAKRAPRVSAVGEVIGSDWRYTVRKGDTLIGISRRFFTDPGTLARLNYISNGQVRPGRSLRIPSLHILPLRTEEGVLLNIPERALYVFRRRLVVGRYPVAVGMRSWPTPVGSYEILSMVVDPVWVTPMEMVQREGAAPAALPAHQKSPLGDRWMGWCEVKSSDSAVGFHGTHDVNSIGKLASHACVRLYPEHARQMFDQVYEGMPVISIYEPIKVGKAGGTYYLSVSPDIYGRGKVTMAAVKERLRLAGIRNVDWKQIAAILAKQDGYPYPLARR